MSKNNIDATDGIDPCPRSTLDLGLWTLPQPRPTTTTTARDCNALLALLALIALIALLALKTTPFGTTSAGRTVSMFGVQSSMFDVPSPSTLDLLFRRSRR